jgi:hypothetical protein
MNAFMLILLLTALRTEKMCENQQLRSNGVRSMFDPLLVQCINHS